MRLVIDVLDRSRNVVGLSRGNMTIEWTTSADTGMYIMKGGGSWAVGDWTDWGVIVTMNTAANHCRESICTPWDLDSTTTVCCHSVPLKESGLQQLYAIYVS